MMIDLDHFKNVNDTFGHVVGDELLRQVATRLSRSLRESDTLARVGGDEFVLLGEDISCPQDVKVIAGKIVDTMNEPFEIHGSRLYVTTSIGATLYPGDAASATQLLKNADLALYRVKHEGRGRYLLYSPEMDVELLNVRRLEDGLRRALADGTLQLFYQPTFSLGDGRIQGVEALLRWPLPDGGYVMPATFIPIAETSGLIVPLGEWVLCEACRQARTWLKAGYHLRVAVNLSAIQLREPDFDLLIKRLLKENGLLGNILELEITEGVFLDLQKRPSRRRCARSRRWVCNSPSTISEPATPASATSRTFPSTVSRSTLPSSGTSASPQGRRQSSRRSSPSVAVSASRSRPRAWRPTFSWRSCETTCATRRKASCSLSRPRPATSSLCSSDRVPARGANAMRSRRPRGHLAAWAFNPAG